MKPHHSTPEQEGTAAGLLARAAAFAGLLLLLPALVGWLATQLTG